MRLIIFVILFVLCSHTESVLYGYEDPSLNLVSNWDFEEEISENDWNLCSTSAERISGGYTGNYSLRVFDRLFAPGSPCQVLDTVEKGLKKNTNYYFSVFIKITSIPPNETFPYVDVVGKATVQYTESSDVTHNCGMLPYVLTEDHWFQMGGDFKTTDEDFTGIEIKINVDPLEAEYVVDTWSLIELEHDPNWQQNLYQKAREIRMENQTVIGNIGPGIEVIPGQTKVNIDLLRHEFAIGTAIKANFFNAEDVVNINYRNFVREHFNWITFENDMKWIQMEKTFGDINYQRIDTAMDLLSDLNMTYRGHLILWDEYIHNADWVNALEGQEMVDNLDRRIDYMLNYYGGFVYEWDVNNEYLHGHLYEFQARNWSLIEGMFRRSHEVDPTSKLCLNDYEVARGYGLMASAQTNLATNLLAAGAPIGCIGVQSHLRNLELDPEALQKRMEIVSSAGLPISITELSFHSYNMSIRTYGVELAWRVYMATPSIIGFTLWGFGDQFNPFSDDHYLTEGIEFTPNQAGQRFLDLLYGDYHTSEEVVLTESTFTYEFPAFRGNYRLTVENSGVVEYETDFYVGQDGDHVFTFTTP